MDPNSSSTHPGGGVSVYVGPSPYLVLGVSKDATQEDIYDAYRRRLKQSHPDKLYGAQAGTVYTPEQITQAYNELKPDARRKREEVYAKQRLELAEMVRNNMMMAKEKQKAAAAAVAGAATVISNAPASSEPLAKETFGASKSKWGANEEANPPFPDAGASSYSTPLTSKSLDTTIDSLASAPLTEQSALDADALGATDIGAGSKAPPEAPLSTPPTKDEPPANVVRGALEADAGVEELPREELDHAITSTQQQPQVPHDNAEVPSPSGHSFNNSPAKAVEEQSGNVHDSALNDCDDDTPRQETTAASLKALPAQTSTANASDANEDAGELHSARVKLARGVLDDIHDIAHDAIVRCLTRLQQARELVCAAQSRSTNALVERRRLASTHPQFSENFNTTIAYFWRKNSEAESYAMNTLALLTAAHQDALRAVRSGSSEERIAEAIKDFAETCKREAEETDSKVGQIAALCRVSNARGGDDTRRGECVTGAEARVEEVLSSGAGARKRVLERAINSKLSAFREDMERLEG